MNKQERRSITDLLNDHALIQRALRRAIQEAARQHAQAGLAMAAWQDGKVVWVPAEEVLARLSQPEKGT